MIDKDVTVQFNGTPLSNFSPHGFMVHDIYYPTNEHYFQAMKTRDEELRRKVAAASSPGEAKRMGRKIDLREDWERSKLHVMRYGLSLKFSFNTAPANYLLSTGNSILQEGNTWGDTFWGIDLNTGVGQNWLGWLLMAQRGYLRGFRSSE